jgi:hypothetical protein
MMGFGAMEERQKALVASELPHVMDDIASLIKVGYTVILDSAATGEKLRDALYSSSPDLSGLRTAGVYWSSDGFEDGSVSTSDGSRLSPGDISPNRVDRLLRLLVICASHSSAAARQWNTNVGPGAFVSTWSGQREANHVVQFLTAGGGHAEGLDVLIKRHLLNPAPPMPEPVVELEGADDEPVGATVAMAAVTGPLSAPPPAEIAANPPAAAHAAAPAATPNQAKPGGLDGIANSVFQAFSGGKSLDDVIGEQMSKHKILGGVAATVLPGLVSFAGNAAASKVKDKDAADAIKRASQMTSKALEDANPDKEHEPELEAIPLTAEPVAVVSPPPLPEPARVEPDQPTRDQITGRVHAAANRLNAVIEPAGDWLRIKVPLSHRSHQVYVATVGTEELTVTLHCNVGHVAAGVDLRGPLRQVAQTTYAKLAISTDDRGDLLVCQGTLPSGALTAEHLEEAIDELAGFADGLEAWLFGGDTN